MNKRIVIIITVISLMLILQLIRNNTNAYSSLITVDKTTVIKSKEHIFKDDEVEKAVKKIIGSAYVTENDLLKVKDLAIPYNGGWGRDSRENRDLSDLRLLKNLENLAIRVIKIPNLNVVSGLTNLKTLIIGDNENINLQALHNLNKLNTLYIMGSNINDLSTIENMKSMKNLKRLIIENGPPVTLKKVPHLEKLKELESVELTGVKGDFSSLKLLKKLKVLTLNNCGIKDAYYYIENIPTLEFVNINNKEFDLTDYFELKAKDHKAVFKDVGLENIVRKIIGKPSGEIYINDLKKVTEINDDGNAIKDIRGIENLFNLQKLYLGDGQITNIEPLKKLHRLTVLNLGRNHISNIDALGELISVTDLDLGTNQISNIEPIKNLRQLTNLNLGKNKISNLDVLGAKNGLIDVNLLMAGSQQNGIDPMKGLSNLSEYINLTDLNLGTNQISRIDELKELPVLINLNLGTNQISDINTIDEFTNLYDLNLGENHISNLRGLRHGLASLDALNLGSNKVSSIEVLKGQTSITKLDLGTNDISSIETLAVLTNLTDVNLGINRISNIEAIKKLLKLSRLSLGENQIRGVEALIGLINLTDLDLGTNHISSVESLKALPKLNIIENMPEKSESNIGQNPDNNSVSQVSIQSIKDINVNLKCYDDYHFLHEISATMSDNTQAEFTVTWDKEQIDTSKAGVYTYYGEVDGYSKKVKLIITVVPVTISLNKKVITLNSGETETLAATIVPSDINLNDLKWYSSSNSIAIVDNNGKITALNSGSAIITVRTSNGLIKDTCTVNVTNMDAIKFPDEAFEKAIRRSIRKLSGDILKSDLEKITVLSAESFNITNISGVENLINLEKLYLADNKISDINTLSGLVKLDTLNIDNNQISDISSIKNLKRLQQLFFDQNIINNISVLSNLTKLRLLYIRNNSINEADILSLKKVLPKCIIFYK